MPEKTNNNEFNPPSFHVILSEVEGTYVYYYGIVREASYAFLQVRYTIVPSQARDDV